jgi:putative membrane-bound dehydrogenase-like protein
MPRSERLVSARVSSLGKDGRMRCFRLKQNGLSSAVVLLATLCVWATDVISPAQEKKPAIIPHAQDKPPNEPRDPQTAARMMTVPEGFSVEVVAAEPDIVNPVAMAIDERGRFWITESLEYPRREAGPGRDRVKILEDTDGDGKCDKFSIFLDGLNIPSGVAVGHGGVWIANSPDILFVPDANRDGKPDGPAQVVVTGFGRTDTHELPNSLTWGPDGWLYGLNGVFNHSKVTYPPDSPWLKRLAEGQGLRGEGQDKQHTNGKERNTESDSSSSHRPSPLSPQPRTEFTFTCAMFRIHPRTREFQVFAEGTSNPWGIAFNDEGEAFVSACVIDHLWHIVETGYYHRQGGPYPPFTWKIDSIVKHKHQKAAYCGIHYFDSDAYPEQYRKKLYMGNIHGGCINVDKLQRNGSTYFATGEPDFLTANDAWFMPVVQKTGPDGCLYILDWYDRYHCYQDANRDPAGIDRLKGRLYRVRYKDSPRTPRDFDLAKETDEQLIERLGANNDFIRWTATRLLQERDNKETWQKLGVTARNREATETHRRQAFFAWIGMPRPPETPVPDIIKSLDPPFAAWRQRMQFTDPKTVAEIVKSLPAMRKQFADHLAIATAPDPPQAYRDHPAVGLQFVIGLSKLGYVEGIFESWLYMLAVLGNDPIIPRVIWQNMHPHLEQHADDFIAALNNAPFLKHKPVADLMPRVVDRLLGRQKFDAQPIEKLFALLRDDHPQVGRDVLAVLATKVQSGELKGDKLEQLKTAMFELLTPLLADDSKHPLANDAALLAVSWGDPRGLPHVRRSFATRGVQPDLRLKALAALIAAQADGVLDAAAQVLDSKTEAADFKSQILASLGRLEEARVADVLLARYTMLEPSLQPAIVDLLTQRMNWSKKLLAEVGEKKIAATAINVNQARRMQALKDKELNDLLSRHWGQVRDTRNPDREKVVAEMKSLIQGRVARGEGRGDPFAGEKIFKRVCAACHKIYGEGSDIGPDITSNGRNDFNQLLSNVFDPSLVIGAGYRVCTVVTTSGRVQSGLLVEDSPQRVVLKPAAVAPVQSGAANAPVTVAVGKLEIIPRDEIDEFKINELSLMPEGLEKQLTPQEIVDLFAFLILDKHPSDKTAKRLPGVE